MHRQEMKESIESIAATKIQKWYRHLPFRQALALLNGHNKEQKIAAVDPTERALFVSQFKNALIDKTQLPALAKRAEKENLVRLAISALKDNLLTLDETSVLLEISQMSRVYGSENLRFYSFLDSKQKHILEGESRALFLEICMQRRSDAARDFTSEEFEEILKKNPPHCNLFYGIVDKKLYLSSPKALDFHQYVTLNRRPAGRDNFFLTPSFSARDIIGKILYPKTWFKLKFRLGTFTNDDLLKAQQRGVRLASVSAPGVNLPERFHNAKVTACGATRHDEHHREIVSIIPKFVHQALDRMIFKIREVVQQDFLKSKILEGSKRSEKWSKELFFLTDRGIITKRGLSTYRYESKKSDQSNESIFSDYIIQIDGFKPQVKSFEDQMEEIMGGIEFQEVSLLDPKKDCPQTATSVVMWILIMDMVDNNQFWKDTLKINPESDDLIFKKHIALYIQLKEKFHSFTIQQKIFLLEQIFHELYDEPLEDDDDLDDEYEVKKSSKADAKLNVDDLFLKYSSKIPAENTLAFRKTIPADIEDESEKYLFFEEIQELHPARVAIDRNRIFLNCDSKTEGIPGKWNQNAAVFSLRHK